MSGTQTRESHEDRTAREPRDLALHDVVIVQVTRVGSLVRLFRLLIPAGQPDIKFLPGQWVDCFVPGIAKAGGFTITSTPSQATKAPIRYIELAVKASPANPVAAWLWQGPVALILGQTLRVRVGGSFVLSPRAGLDFSETGPARIVFVAGGVGVNPLVSMACHLGELHDTDTRAAGEGGPEVVFLYSVREEPGTTREDGGDGGHILFLRRLASLFDQKSVRGELKFFLTGGKGRKDGKDGKDDEDGVPCERRRMATADVDAAVLGAGGRGRDSTDQVHVYVCGVPTMTDAFVAHLTGSKASGGLGLAAHQVRYEKWW